MLYDLERRHVPRQLGLDQLFGPLEFADCSEELRREESGKLRVGCGLMKKSVLPSLLAYLESGERKVSAWQKSLNYIEVDFSDDSEAFTNLNTFEDLAALELKLNKT